MGLGRSDPFWVCNFAFFCQDSNPLLHFQPWITPDGQGWRALSWESRVLALESGSVGNVTSCLRALVFLIYGRLGSWSRLAFPLAFCFSHRLPIWLFCLLFPLVDVITEEVKTTQRSIKSDVFIFFKCQDRIFLFLSPTSRYPSHSPFCFYGLKDVITKLLISPSCQAGSEKSTSFSNFLFLGFLSPFLCVNLMDYLISLLELFAYRIFILFPF